MTSLFKRTSYERLRPWVEAIFTMEERGDYNVTAKYSCHGIDVLAESEKEFLAAVAAAKDAVCPKFIFMINPATTATATASTTTATASTTTSTVIDDLTVWIDAFNGETGDSKVRAERVGGSSRQIRLMGSKAACEAAIERVQKKLTPQFNWVLSNDL